MLSRLVERHRIETQLRRSLDDLNFPEVEPPMFVKIRAERR
jgi:aspartyl-tRNA synthetase